MSGAWTVEIYLHQMGQRRERRLLRIEGVAAVLSDDYTESGEAHYRLPDGRRCVPDGTPCAWDFWRLDVRTLRSEPS